ncbi:MAG: hypothetical protein N4A57_13540 [Anaeromicrobium sp.]|jgi:hypothetical protein|uniref:hypothetical protein n=1 Tax=Anaeromicrobium sp. TaxID=1929132 RepID=UPI0025CEB9FD|nr:hypothetical protein [Anaeromicrobium sp.]MCT4595267.1 hypothetical protein [Anaeromicrobium sp.]
MKIEGYRDYLIKDKGRDEVDKIMEVLGKLEAEYKIALDEMVKREEEVQRLRTTIYFDTDLTPRDKRMYPEVLKSYYTFATGKELPPMRFKKKGQKYNS